MDISKSHDNCVVHAGYGRLPRLLLLLYLLLPLWAIWYFASTFQAMPMNTTMTEMSPREMGKHLAAQQGCFACHGPEGKGGVENPGHKDGFVPGWNSEDLVSTTMYYPIVLRQEIEKAVIPGMYQDPTDIGTQEFAPYKMQPWIGRLSTQQINYIMVYIYSINPALQEKMASILQKNYDQKEFAQVSGDINPAFVGFSFGNVTTKDGTPLGTPAIAQFPPGVNYPLKYQEYYDTNQGSQPPQWLKDIQEFKKLSTIQ